MPTPLTNDRWGYESSCFVCERSNPGGLQIPFFLSDDETQVTADFSLGAEHSGAPSLLHGGVSLAILDEAQAWAAIAIAGRWGLTRSTQATFDGALFIDHKHTVRAWVVEAGLKQVRTEGVIVDEGGVEAVRSMSSFTVVGVVDETQRAFGLAPEHHGLLGNDFVDEG